MPFWASTGYCARNSLLNKAARERSHAITMGDASFLLKVEVFLLTVICFTYGGGTVSKKDQTDSPP